MAAISLARNVSAFGRDLTHEAVTKVPMRLYRTVVTTSRNLTILMPQSRI